MNLSHERLAIQDLMDASGVRFGTSGARGPVTGMTDELCFAFTSAFLNAISATSGAVALAIDLRPSSPRIAASCAAAIEHAGLRVEYCGAIPTPALALYAQTYGLPGIMVTGSHIPFDRNGIKFYGPAGEITKVHESLITRAAVDMPEGELTIDLPQASPAASQHYADRYLHFFPPNCLSGMKLGFYEHSSVARDLLQEILEMLGAQVIPLGRVDEFVPIDTEAVSDADVMLARRWADQHGFDAILSTDGDADRPLIGDERGHWLRGDVTGILCARYLGAQGVVTTISCNTAVELCGSFPKVLRTRIGSPYVIEGIEQLIQSGAPNVVGFEPNGGFLVGSRFEKNARVLTPLLTRDAVLPILCLLSMARERGCPVSELPRMLPPRFTASDRLQSFPTETSHEMLSELAASDDALTEFLAGLCGKPRRLDRTEGLRIYLANEEIVFFRPSGNAPELRCYAESASPERAGLLVQQCLQRMKARFDAQRSAQARR